MAKKDTQDTQVEKNGGTAGGFFQAVYRLRGILLSVPVAAAAIIMAIYSSRILPDQVGIFMQANGQFQFILSRPVAILAPLAITLVCLTITMCCRRVIYPWLVSLFSLVIPPLLWFTSFLAG